MPYKDPAIARAYHQDWHRRNRDQVRARLKADYQANRESRLAAMRKWNEEHPGWQRGRALKRRRKYPFLHLLKAAKGRAVKKGVPYSLTEEWAAQRWTGSCELTGIAFAFREDGKTGPMARSPSIDRVKPSIGYVPENCRFVLHCINSMKHDSSEEEMYEVAMALLARRTRQ